MSMEKWLNDTGMGEHNFFPVALRNDSGSWPPLTGFRDHTHWTHYTRQDSSRRVISPTQRPLPDNTRDKHLCSRAGFEPPIPPSERPQTHALDGAGKTELLNEKSIKVLIFPPQFLTWTCLELNTGLRVYMPLADRLSHGKSFKTVNTISSG